MSLQVNKREELTLIDLVPTRIYAKLFSASYLSRKRFRINNFAKLVDFLCWEKREKREIVVYSLDEDLRYCLKDLAEKLGFVVLSFDILIENLKSDNVLMKLPDEVRWKKVKENKTKKHRLDKYYWYNFIIYSKASLDSIAVTLNSFFGFGFVGGQIDFGKARFVEKVSSLQQFANYSKTYGKWIESIINYRDAIIHQKSIDITSSKGQWLIPSRPLTMKEIDEFIMEYDSLKDAISKKRIESNLVSMNLGSFMKKSIENLRSLAGLLSTEILRELQRRNPNHKPSHTYYW